MNVFTSYKKTESLDKLKERMQSFASSNQIMECGVSV